MVVTFQCNLEDTRPELMQVAYLQRLHAEVILSNNADSVYHALVEIGKAEVLKGNLIARLL